MRFARPGKPGAVTRFLHCSHEDAEHGVLAATEAEVMCRAAAAAVGAAPHDVAAIAEVQYTQASHAFAYAVVAFPTEALAQAVVTTRPPCTRHLALRFAAEFVAPTEPRRRRDEECVEDADALHIPGVTLVHEFVTAAEERELLCELDTYPPAWQQLVKREVKQYGHAFRYSDRSEHGSGCDPAPAMPPLCAALAARIAATNTAWFQQSESDSGNANVNEGDEQEDERQGGPDQLTVNRYAPGSGIGAHTDTHSAFGPTIAAVSLGSGCAFVLTTERSLTDQLQEKQRKQHQPTPGTTPSAQAQRGVLFVPARSLLVLTGPARYQYTHQIPFRAWDLVGGRRIERGTRVSLTFRRVLASRQCHCAYPDTCDSQSQRQRASSPT